MYSLKAEFGAIINYNNLPQVKETGNRLLKKKEFYKNLIK